MIIRNDNAGYLGVLVAFLAAWWNFYQARLERDLLVATSEFPYVYETGPTVGEYVFGSLAIFIALYLIYAKYMSVIHNRKTFLDRDLSRPTSNFTLIGLVIFTVCLLIFFFTHTSAN